MSIETPRPSEALLRAARDAIASAQGDPTKIDETLKQIFDHGCRAGERQEWARVNPEAAALRMGGYGC